MTGPLRRAALVSGVSLGLAGALLAVWGSGPEARALAAPAKKPSGSASLLPGASSKDPVNIDAQKLDYFDKEQKLVYSGDVVAKQGESTLRASVLTIFMAKDPKKQDGATASAADPKSAGNSVRRMEAKGPVTIISKDQVGTGDNGTYDKVENKITLVGNVTLSQGTNVIKGDKLVYDMTSGQAQVSSGQTLGRVTSVFTPGSGTPGGASKKPQHGAAGSTAKSDSKPASVR